MFNQPWTENSIETDSYSFSLFILLFRMSDSLHREACERNSLSADNKKIQENSTH